MLNAFFIRGGVQRRAQSACIAGRSLSCLLGQPVSVAGSSGLEFFRGRLQVVPQSAMQWGSLWLASGPLGVYGTLRTVWSRTSESCCDGRLVDWYRGYGATTPCAPRP
jgi:hypothetical protein